MPLSGERIYERMFRFEFEYNCDNVVIRIWAKVDLKRDLLRRLITATVQDNSLDELEIVTRIANALPELVNAVEMLDAKGEGALAYNQWP